MVAEFVSLKKQSNIPPSHPQTSPLLSLDEFSQELANFAKFQRIYSSNSTMNDALDQLKALWNNYLRNNAPKYHLLRANNQTQRQSWQRILADFQGEIDAFLSPYSVKERRLISSFFVVDALRKVVDFFSLIPDEETMGIILVEQRETFLCFWLEYSLFKEHLMFRHSMIQFLAESVEFLLFA